MTTRIKCTPGTHEFVELNGMLLTPEASLKIMNHSPTGFSWGYAGSGPAQLALAILTELYGEKVAARNYQDFKREFVAKWPFNEPYEGEFDVDGWIAPRMFAVGDKVRLTRHVERYPHFYAEAGMEGKVVLSNEEMICVRMDLPIPGAQEWDNEVHWYLPNGDGEDIVKDLEVLSTEQFEWV